MASKFIKTTNESNEEVGEEQDLEYDEDSEFEAEINKGDEEDEDDEDEDEDEDDDDKNNNNKKKNRGKSKKRQRKKTSTGSSLKKRTRTVLDEIGDLAAVEADEVAALNEEITNSYGKTNPSDKSKKKGSSKISQIVAPVDKYSRESGSAFSSAVSDAMAKMLRDASLAEKPRKENILISSQRFTFEGPLPGTTAFANTDIAKQVSKKASQLLGDYSSLGSPSTVALFVHHTALASCNKKYIDNVDSFFSDLREESGDVILQNKNLKQQRVLDAKKSLLHPLVQNGDSFMEDISELSSSISVTENKSDPDKKLHEIREEKLHEIAKAALKRVASRKIAISKTVKFAGETRTVTQYVDDSSSLPRSSLSTSIGAIVSGLDKPEAISTLSKTNLDWEQYKTKEGLDEAFEARAQQYGFVERQDFLSRVDDRSAEADRQRRIEERRQRELSNPTPR
jgi:hypothetical protein